MVRIVHLRSIPELLTIAGRYMSTGLGRGNPYGLAAVCGVFFPFMMFGRLYWPGPPMANVLFFITAVLVGCYLALLKSRVLTAC